MSFLMPKPKFPQPAAVAPAAVIPERADPAIAEARQKEREAMARRKGRGALNLTGGLGDTTQANVSRPRLLGQTATAA